MNRPLRTLAAIASLSLLAACAGSTRPASSPVASSAKAVDMTIAGPASTPKLTWNDFDQGIFTRAKSERRFVVLDGAAEWCHFCHVMEEKTYADPRVRAVLDKHFIAAKVDVDVRPDIEERYGDYGWPATILFSPEGEELGKYRGFIPPDDFLDILNTVVSGGVRAEKGATAEAQKTPKQPLADDTLDWIVRNTELELEEYWDPKEGGWGREPKVPLGWNTLWALSRAKRGDARQREHALTILEKERKIIDPVWGGIYQYSVAPDWDHPHFEKLMAFNAGALASYAQAFALTKDAKYRGLANDIRRYLEGFMLSPGGAFYGTQDADLNAHAADLPFASTSPRGTGQFLSGEAYYKLDANQRRALGVPRIDPNEYADDNGLAIHAYAELARATDDPGAIAVAKRAADRILSRHRTAPGGLTHVAPEPGKNGEPPPDPTRRLHLSDSAAFGFGLAHLSDVAKEPRYREEAARVAAFLEKELYDPEGGGFFSQRNDPNAVGVFRVRGKPFDDNVLALRFLVLLDTLEGTPKRRTMIEHSFRAISTPNAIKDRGKFLGDYLSLVDEIRAYRRLR
jgi:uncharacterized protein YyaL (SSP411 family)